MDIIGLTLNSVCIGFFIFLLLIYFSKKNANNIDNRIYRYILLCNFFIIFFEILYILFAYMMPNDLFIIEIMKRLSLYFMLLFFLALGYYIFSIAIEKNKKWLEKYNNYRDFIFKILLVSIFLMGYFQFTMRLDFFYKADGSIDYMDGPASNLLTIIVVTILLAIVIPTIIINRKTIDKKKIFPFYIVALLEVVTFIVNSIDLSLCLASFSLTITCFLMYFTIENPDLKTIAKLEYAKNQAERANNAKSDFLSSMSHEIRTPLNAIVGLSEMIETSDNIKEIHADSKDILVASQNLLEIVNGILDINKIEANKMDIVESNYNPRTVFNELVKLMNIRIGSKPLELRTFYDDNLPAQLYGDREKIKQIISNLLTNAVKYTEKGVIEFRVICVNESDHCNLTIIVKDTGRGIKEEQIPKLFTKFNRLEEDKDTDIEGTGLGLAITKSLVELFNGTISVESVYGEGSTFTVKLTQKIMEDNSSEINNLEQSDISEKTLSNSEVENKNVSDNDTKNNSEDTDIRIEKNIPTISIDNSEVSNTNSQEENNVVTKIEENEQIHKEDNSNSNKNENISNDTNLTTSQVKQSSTSEKDESNILLVVDDNRMNLKVASRMLEDLHFNVDMAHSGLECLQKIESDKNKYDIIFMDIMMPEMDGVETLNRLRNMKDFNTPVIALTADSMDGSREKYLAVGFDEYISKPIIKQVLEEVLGKYVAIDDIDLANK